MFIFFCGFNSKQCLIVIAVTNKQIVTSMICQKSNQKSVALQGKLSQSNTSGREKSQRWSGWSNQQASGHWQVFLSYDQ